MVRNQATSRVVVERPKAPLLGYTKIHADASLAGNDIAGSAAVVCGGTTGLFHDSPALTIHGINEVAALEAIVCREALCLADDLLLKISLLHRTLSRWLVILRRERTMAMDIS